MKARVGLAFAAVAAVAVAISAGVLLFVSNGPDDTDSPILPVSLDSYDLLVQQPGATEPIVLFKSQSILNFSWSGSGTQLLVFSGRESQVIRSYAEPFSEGKQPEWSIPADGESIGATWSPDGRFVALQQFADGGTRLSVLDPSDGEMQPATADFERALTFAGWRNESKMVFTSTTGLREFDAASGESREIAAFDGRPTLARLSPDGDSLAVIVETDQESAVCGASRLLGDLWLVDIDSGGTRLFAESICEVVALDWSPDGSRIVYSLASNAAGAAPGIGVYSVDVTSGQTIQLTRPGGGVDFVAGWYEDGSLLVSRSDCYACDGGAGMQLIVTPQGEESLLKDETAPFAFSSPDGRYVFRLQEGGFSFAIEAAEAPPTGPALVRQSSYPWSADSGWIAFSRPPEPVQRFYEIGADGSGLREISLLDPPPEVSPASLSPDGSRVASLMGYIGEAELLLADASGNNPMSVDVDDPGHLAWSPAGDRLLVTGFSSGRISVVDAADGSVKELELDYSDLLLGLAPAWSPDGSRVATYTEGLTMVDLADGSSRLLTGPGPVHQAPSWSGDGETLAYVHTGIGNRNDIFLIPADGSGARRRLTETSQVEHTLALSAGARQIAFFRDTGLGSDLVLLDIEAGNESVLYQVASTNLSPPALVWSPDGARLAFISPETFAGAIFIVEVESGSAYQLVSTAARLSGLRWLDDESLGFSTYVRVEKGL